MKCRQDVIDKLQKEMDSTYEYILEFNRIGNITLFNVHQRLYHELRLQLGKELQLQHEDKMRELLTGYSANVIDQGIAGIQPQIQTITAPYTIKGTKYFANLMSNTTITYHSVDKNMNPIKPRTNIGRIITKTHLVYDLVKKKKYIAQVSDRLTTFEEVDTDRPATHTSYDGSEKLMKVKDIEIEQLLYYISKGVYSEMELRKMVLKEIKGKKSVFMDKGKLDRKISNLESSFSDTFIFSEDIKPNKDRINVFKQVCRRFDRCEKLVKMASVKDYSNLNEAGVAYRMLMKEYTIIIVTLMGEGVNDVFE